MVSASADTVFIDVAEDRKDVPHTTAPVTMKVDHQSLDFSVVSAEWKDDPTLGLQIIVERSWDNGATWRHWITAVATGATTDSAGKPALPSAGYERQPLAQRQQWRDAYVADLELRGIKPPSQDELDKQFDLGEQLVRVRMVPNKPMTVGLAGEIK